MSEPTPWLTPTVLADWPTRELHNPELHLTVAVGAGWVPSGVEQLGTHTEANYRHADGLEGLTAHFIEDADPVGDIRNWVNVGLAAGPTPVAHLSAYDARLVEWKYNGSSNSASRQFGVDEAHTYEGLAEVTADHVDLVRVYVLLARRARQAWKLELLLNSACPAGSTTDVVQANDGVRAGAVLGSLRLESQP